jgi:hypothetical protein
MKRLLIATLVAVSAGTHAADGGPLLTMCEKALSKPGVGVGSQDAFQAGYCIGTLDAAFDALVIEGAESASGPTVCPKLDSGDPLTLVKVVVKYLKANPKAHAQPSALAVRKALRQALPCS